MRAQDAAMEERVGKLNGYVQDLQEENAGLKRKIAGLEKEIQSLREQASQPNASYASQEDLRKLAEKLQEVDRKRVEDNERIAKQIENLGKTLSGNRNRRNSSQSRPDEPPRNNSSGGAPAAGKGFEHVVASGDTLSTIAQAYSKETGFKITVDQILKANPGLVAEKLKVGQTIFIPKPE